MNSFDNQALRDRRRLLATLSAWPRSPRSAENAATTGTCVIFSTETRLVPLSVTVQDKSGHLVTNLPQTAFQVFENGVVQPIKMFKREDVEISLGLIIDNSGSMRDKRKQVATAALDLVKDSNPQDEVFIVNFNDEAFLDCRLHQRYVEDGAGADQDRFPRRHGHARRHPHVDRSSEEQAPSGTRRCCWW